jgi:outer membrane receptor protein involved in Fe transport
MLGGVASFAIVAPSFAQTAMSSTAPPKSSGGQSAAPSADGISEVVVTATRRAEKLQNVPASITALPQSFIQDTGAQKLADVVAAVPGLSLDQGLSGSQVFTIRGANTTSLFSNAQSPVGLYIDEVPVLDPFLPISVPHLQLFDVNRVEVLLGPQGTLFGAGSLGGAIRVITNKPNMTQFEAATEDTVQGASRGAPSDAFNGMVNLPLIKDQLALRVDGFYDHNGGWVYNTGRNEKDANRSEVSGGRAELRWTPTANFSVTGTYSTENNRIHDAGYTVYGSTEYVNNNVIPQHVDGKNKIYNLVAEYDLPWATFTSSTSYLTKASTLQDDVTTVVEYVTGVTALSPIIDDIHSSEFIQEFRLTSKRDTPLRWLVGAYYQNYHFSDHETIPQSGAGAALAKFGYPSDLLEDDLFRVHMAEDALFGEISYDFTPKLTLTVGGRVFYEPIAAQIDQIQPAYFIGPAGVVNHSGRYSSGTPKINLSYRALPDVLLYGQITEGYRSGNSNLSPNQDPVSKTPIPGTYGPDQLWNYEIGAKTQLFDRRLTLNASAYYIDWKNILLEQQTPGAGDVYVGNAGDATIKGVELEVVARPVQAFELGTSLSYHDGILNSVQKGTQALPGDRLPGSSPFTAYVYGQYKFKITNEVSAFVRGDYSYASQTFNLLKTATTTPLSYGDVSSLGAQFNLRYRNYELLLFANNLADTRGRLNAQTLGVVEQEVLQAPRTIGLTLRAHY